MMTFSLLFFKLIVYFSTKQMIELMKEQVYHSNIVNSLTASPEQRQHPLLTELETTSLAYDSGIHQRESPTTLLDHLSLLQRQMETSQTQTANALTDTMKEVCHSHFVYRA